MTLELNLEDGPMMNVRRGASITYRVVVRTHYFVFIECSPRKLMKIIFAATQFIVSNISFPSKVQKLRTKYEANK